MINAAIVGLGWWGKTLVGSCANSEAIRFVAGATRTVTPEIEAFAKQHGLRLLPKYDAVLADREADAMVLATPHSLHGAQVVAAAGARKHVFCEKPFTLTKREAEEAVAGGGQNRGRPPRAHKRPPPTGRPTHRDRRP